MRTFSLMIAIAACTPDEPPDKGPSAGPSSTDTAEFDTAGTGTLSGVLVLNEVMPRNNSTWTSETGTRPDWIEIINVSDAPIPWSSVTLTDDGIGQWVGSDGTIAPGERVLLTTDILGFGLDADADGASVWVDGELSDRVTWEEVGRDLSVARVPDQTGDWAITGWPTPGEPNGEVSPTPDAADATVFVSDQVHVIELQVTEEAYDLLAEGTSFIGTFNDYKKVEASLTIDGVAYPSVGLRRKGSASTDPLGGKPPFKVDLNHIIPGTRFRTLKGFNLHNGKLFDPTLIHEHLSYSLARASGLAAPRVGWAVVSLNGLDYGIYALVEQHDDVFVERNFPGAGDDGVVLEPNESTDGGFLSAGDFGRGALNWDFEEGAIPVDTELVAVVEGVNDLVSGPANDAAVAQLWSLVERDAVLTYFAWENVVGHTDGYHVPNNWRVYIDPDTQKLQLLPSGADWTWDGPADPWFWGGRLADWCLSNAGCEAGIGEKMVEVADTVDAIDLAGDYGRIWAGLEVLVRSQPRPNHNDRAIDSAHNRTKTALQDFPTSARAAACNRVPSTCGP